MYNLKKKLLVLLLLLFVSFSLINFFNPNKTDVSEMENRKLDKVIELNFLNLANGSFFASIDSWFSDTFIFRDKLLSMGAKLTNVLNIGNIFKKEDMVEIISVKTEDLGKTDEIDLKKTKRKNEAVNINIDNYRYEDDGDGHAEGLPNGYVFYNGIAYSRPSFSKNNAISFLDSLDKYSKTFDNARTLVVIAPLSSLLLYGNDKINLNLLDQNDAINELMPYAKENMYFVNPCKELLDHRDEYIFFKYDHHWTQRGAYYAYKTFCDVIGEDAVSIDDMEERILNKAWSGSAYKYTYDQRLLDKTDIVYAYVATRSNTMIVQTNEGKTVKNNNCIMLNYNSYGAFICGDNPFTIIDVADMPKDKSCLVIKDSYGCAFVPWLINNYGYIFVIDPRYTDFDFVSAIKPFNITDIISISSVQRICYAAYRDMVDNLIEKWTNKD